MSPLPRVSFIKGDITDSKTIDEVKQRIGGTADLVLSDCSPNVTGIWEVDVTRQLDLAERTIDLAMKILTKNGKTLTKVFQGPGFKEFLESVKDRFELVRLVKPDASRKTSAEIYMLAMHPKGVKE
jgi:23S rRNA (uridine2552-2'-O)-methyltransferase